MKKMTRLKLINWHYFIDVTIDLNGGCLITGDNGSGKSTILDAIQFVLTGGKARFNNAAHEKARRDLVGYVRCKTGKDSSEYERSGDVTAHAAVEFYEEKKNKYFILGAVIDSSSDLNSPKVIFYRIENGRISDELFMKGNIPRNISDFKIRVKSLDAKVHMTQSAAQNDYIHRFGSINYRFFNLLPKALAFRPINNVKDFVYSYVLDEKEVNIEYLKENVRTYMEFEKILKEIKHKLEKLDAIHEKHNEIQRIQENVKIHDYIITRGIKEIEERELEKKRLEEKQIDERLKKGQGFQLNLQAQLDGKNHMADELHKSLLENQSYQLMNTLDNEIKTLQREYDSLSGREKEFDRYLLEELEKAKGLYEKQIDIQGLEDFAVCSKELVEKENIENFAKAAIILEDSYSKYHQDALEHRAKLRFDKKNHEEALGQIEKDIRILESKRLVYDENIVNLKDGISQGIKQESGKDMEPKIVCELLRIKDPLWKDAIEGYMNTQRFNLIVEPEHFDGSLDIYERIKKKRKIHSVGLINTQKLNQFKDCDENSLAYMVTSENKYAKLYVNMIMGKVVRCEDVQELKKYTRAITPTCMVYQNNTARQIDPKVYSKPYIGEDAYKKQLEIKLAEREEVKQKIKGINVELAELDDIIGILGKSKLEFLRTNSSIKSELKNKRTEITDKQEQLKRIDKSTILGLQLELEKTKKEIKEIQNKLEKLMYEIAENRVTLKNIVNDIDNKKESLETKNQRLVQFEEENIEVVAKAREKYDESVKSKGIETTYYNYLSSRSRFDTQITNKTMDLVQLQRDYNRDYHFGGADGIDGMEDFLREYKNLKESKVVEYEEKINLARERAEEEFKEHFISKLQENILSAQNEFKKLNEALRGIQFGEDEYKFQYTASKAHDKFYRMIMDDANLEGFTLFTGAYRERHKEAMEELFERITIDDEQSQKALEKFTDYRTFMDYDIKIFHKDESSSSFSKVCREKSGGETQTPYYVAIVASFVQLYDSGLNQSESIGLILFDEAFDKMDENRIESMMTFLRKLNLQVIIAAPPQKIESIAPHVGTTLVVSREDKFSWVEALYCNERL